MWYLWSYEIAIEAEGNEENKLRLKLELKNTNEKLKKAMLLFERTGKKHKSLGILKIVYQTLRAFVYHRYVHIWFWTKSSFANTYL